MTFGEWVLMIYATPWVKLTLALILGNIVLGVAVSLKSGVFRLGEVGTWLRSRALPLLLGAGVVKLVILAAGDNILPGIGIDAKWADLVWGFAILELVGKIVENLRELGMPLPAALGSAKSDAPSPPVPAHVEPSPGAPHI